MLVLVLALLLVLVLVLVVLAEEPAMTPPVLGHVLFAWQVLVAVHCAPGLMVLRGASALS